MRRRQQAQHLLLLLLVLLRLPQLQGELPRSSQQP
jgi:hypothetical protein